MNYKQMTSVVFASLLFLPMLSYAEAQNMALQLREQLAAGARVTHTTQPSSQENKIAFQESRALFLKSQRERNKQVVADMALSQKESKEVLDTLEIVLQARVWLLDYLHTHHDISFAQLFELAKKPGNAELADAINKVDPSFTLTRIRSAVSLEKFNRYMELKSRQHDKGRKEK